MRMRRSVARTPRRPCSGEQRRPSLRGWVRAGRAAAYAGLRRCGLRRELCLEEEVCARYAPECADRVHAQRAGVEPAARERQMALVAIGEHVVARPCRSLDGDCVGGESGLVISSSALPCASQVVNASRPPGTRTRCASARARSGCETCRIPKFIVTASNDASGNGSRSASPTTNVRSGQRMRARSTIAVAMSMPTGCAPRAAAASETKPGPHATSRSRDPRAHFRGVAERVDEQNRVGPVLLVAGRRPFPARALELRERVTAHRPHCTAAPW